MSTHPHRLTSSLLFACVSPSMRTSSHAVITGLHVHRTQPLQAPPKSTEAYSGGQSGLDKKTFESAIWPTNWSPWTIDIQRLQPAVVGGPGTEPNVELSARAAKHTH